MVRKPVGHCNDATQRSGTAQGGRRPSAAIFERYGAVQ
jgi:hypothetical protein